MSLSSHINNQWSSSHFHIIVKSFEAINKLVTESSDLVLHDLKGLFGFSKLEDFVGG